MVSVEGQGRFVVQSPRARGRRIDPTCAADFSESGNMKGIRLSYSLIQG